MSLSPGSRLGPYEILSAIGAGGMGEVYKARDTRLDRTVAIKVLPEHVASDPDLKQRFEREAKTISSLNHPHICTLYDIGEQDGIDGRRRGRDRDRTSWSWNTWRARRKIGEEDVGYRLTKAEYTEIEGEGQMSSRTIGVVCGVIAVMVLTSLSAVAQSTSAASTPWGDPDLQGVWDYRTLTPLQRPEEQADKEFLTEEEAASLERDILDRNQRLLTRAPERTAADDQVDRREDGTPGFYNNFWLDRGTTAVSTRRTSLIVDPPDGRLPRLMAEAQRRADSLEASRIAATRRGALPAESWTDLDAGDRCIQHAKAGPPISVGGYNNNIQMFQTPGYVALLNEQNHDVGLPRFRGRVRTWVSSALLQLSPLVVDG